MKLAVICRARCSSVLHPILGPGLSLRRFTKSGFLVPVSGGARKELTQIKTEKGLKPSLQITSKAGAQGSGPFGERKD